MVWWIIATVIAFFIKGLCGFANTMVFTSILSFGNSNVNISPVELILGYPTNVILVWKDRKSIDWKICAPLALLVLLGSIPGAIFLKNANTGMIKTLFGVVIVLIGIYMLVQEFKPRKVKLSPIILFIIGIISGLLCGLYGVGALLGAYINSVTDDIHSFKANMCFVCWIENTFRIAVYAISGIITFAILKQALILIPFMLVSLFLGMLCSRIIKDKSMKKLVIVLLIISGIALIKTSLSH